MLKLENLKENKGKVYPRKRRGRGNASGAGNYSTKGLKGQKARSGGRAGIAGRAIKEYLLRIPKNRGFRSLQVPMATVSVGQLEKSFADNDKVNNRAMLKAGLVKDITAGIKILGSGKLTKKLVVEADAFSAGAKAMIEKAGGQALVVVVKVAKPAAEKK